MFLCRLIAAAFFLVWGACRASDAPASTNPAVRLLSNGVYQVGSVVLNQSNRTVTFAASAHLPSEFPVEYAVVHKTGKTHETLFLTETKAQDLQVALLLLGARAAMTNAFPEDLSLPPPGDPVEVAVRWKKDGTVATHPIEELIVSRATGKPLPHGPWIFNGSNFSEGAFTAQRDGSLISIRIDPDALINNPRPGREDDDLHIANPALIPSTGTKVDIIVRVPTKTDDGAKTRTR